MNGWLIACRAAVAAVWLYQGLWCKLIAPGSHQAVVGAAVGSDTTTSWLLTALGIGEGALAAWVACGWRPFAAATAQTALLVAMNIGGLVLARAHIADPAGMVVMNAAFLTLVWMTAREARRARS
ncbi:MAG TPA: DoxX-like family protein [Planctomycetota bacterium]|nr:DoxX-like family protein [Planctomycetota bacterium]